MRNRVFVGLMALAIIIGGAVSAAAQTRTPNGYLDLNFVRLAPAESSFQSTATTQLYNEAASWTFRYEVPGTNGIDIAGGAFFTPTIGIGIAVSHGASEAPPVITATLPHPRYYNASATGTLTGATPSKRTETAVHMQVVFRPKMSNPRLQVRLFGGPSYFSASQQLVTNFRYNQIWLGSAQQVAITGYDQSDKGGSAWGFNVGGDVAYFFSKTIGVGGMARYAAGSADFPNTAQDIVASGQTQSIKLGGVAFGFGLRVRF